MPEQRELPLTFPGLSPEAPLIPVRMVSLDEHFAIAYGIFGVAPTSLAALRFAAERARWVRRRAMASTSIRGGLTTADMNCKSHTPDPREPVMDILRHGSDVGVLARKRATNHEQQTTLIWLKANTGKGFSGITI